VDGPSSSLWKLNPNPTKHSLSVSRSSKSYLGGQTVSKNVAKDVLLGLLLPHSKPV
jgi:hypothetical protein